jgi:hypothetical protein
MEMKQQQVDRPAARDLAKERISLRELRRTTFFYNGATIILTIRRLFLVNSCGNNARLAEFLWQAVLVIRIRKIRMILGLPDPPDPNPLVRGTDLDPDPTPDPSIFS